MYTIYAIYNRTHDKIYIGQTKNLAERLQLHQTKVFGGSYTSRFDGEWQMIYSEIVENRRDAPKRERQLKSFRGREFVRSRIPW